MNLIIYWTDQSDSLRKVKGYQVKKYLGISLNVCYSLNRLKQLLYHTNTYGPLSIVIHLFCIKRYLYAKNALSDYEWKNFMCSEWLLMW